MTWCTEFIKAFFTVRTPHCFTAHVYLYLYVCPQTAAWPRLRRALQNSKTLNVVVCTAVVTNCTHIGQEGNSVKPRCTVRLTVCQFSSKSEALDKCCGHVQIVQMGQIMVTAQQNLIYSIEYSLVSTARAVMWNCSQTKNC